MSENLSEQQQHYVQLWNQRFCQILKQADEKDLIAILPFIDFGASTWFWNEEVQVTASVASSLNESQLELFLDNDTKGNLDVSDQFNKILRDLMFRAKEVSAKRGNCFTVIDKVVKHPKFSYPGHGSYNRAYSTPATLTPLYQIVEVHDSFPENTFLMVIGHVFCQIVKESDKQAYICDFFSALLLTQKTQFTKEGLALFTKQ